MVQVEKLDLDCIRYPFHRLYPSKFDTFELGRLGRGLKHSDSHRALAALRLVNRTICCSASRVIFRSISFQVNGLDSLEDPQRIFIDRWASYVRKVNITFSLSIIQYHTYTDSVEFPDLLKRLHIFITKLINLKALIFHCPVDVERSELFTNVVATIIRSLSLQSLVELEISHGYYGSWNTEEAVYPMEIQSVPPRGGLENLKDLAVTGHFTHGKDSERELLKLIRSAVNIESLRLGGQYPSNWPNILPFINAHRLRYLQLQGRIFPNHLFNLLRQCKETIRFLAIACDLGGSWLYMLFQISRGLKLLQFDCVSAPRGFPVNHGWLQCEIIKNRRDEYILCLHVQNDIHRQVNANRVAAGLTPFEGELDLQPLKSVMEEEHYQELCSLPEL